MRKLVPLLNRNTCVRYLDGPENRVLLACWIVGAGAVIQALPALSVFAQTHDVTVNTMPWRAPMWESVGVKTISMPEPFGPAWHAFHRNEFNKVYTLHAYDIWQCRDMGTHGVTLMEQFAEILGVGLPEQFSWREVLKPDYVPGEPYILFAPKSYEHWRSVPRHKANEIARELSREHRVIEIGTNAGTFRELLNLIDNASHIVAVEGGVAHIAAALGKRLTILSGVTAAEHHAKACERYTGSTVAEVRGYQPAGCSMPCYRLPRNGFNHNKCLGTREFPECLLHIDTERIISTINEYVSTN